MTHFYFIRHGEKKSSFGDSALTTLGKNQARETGNYLKQFPITKVVSSPLKRTAQTAEIIAQEINLEYDLDKRLAERMNWIDQNVTRQEFLDEWLKATNNRDYKPKYGESSNITGQRMQEVVKTLAKDNQNAHIVLVTHRDATLDYLRTTFGEAAVKPIKAISEKGFSYCQIMNCALTKVVISDKPHLELLNFVDYLSQKSE